MAPKKTEEELEFGVCSEHSGLKVWVQIGCVLLLGNLLAVSYETFKRGPEAAAQIKEMYAQMDKRITIVESTLLALRETDTKIIAQRNMDHANPHFKLQ